MVCCCFDHDIASYSTDCATGTQHKLIPRKELRKIEFETRFTTEIFDPHKNYGFELRIVLLSRTAEMNG